MRRSKIKGQSRLVKEIALERIAVLFKEASKIYSYDPKYSDRYVELARKIAMRFKVKLLPEQRRKFCKHCYSFFVPAKNCRIRAKDGKLVYSCFKCKKFSRFVYKK